LPVFSPIATRVILPSADSYDRDKEMNLIPLVLTIAAIIVGSIFVDFEVGLLLGLIVGLVALQRESHLKIVALQDQIRDLSQPLIGTAKGDLLPKSNFAKPDPDPVDTEAHSTRSTK